MKRFITLPGFTTQLLVFEAISKQCQNSQTPSLKGAHLKFSLFALVVAALYTSPAMSIEEPAFKVRKSYGEFEVREYGPVLVAQTESKETFENAGNQAFRILADFIFGKNTTQTKMEMTAPVTQSEKIAMTAPVNLSKGADGFVVQFVMPAKYTLETLPKPIDPQVKILEVPARQVAVYRYSGSWSEQRYQEKLSLFRELLQKEKILTKGEPTFARFNSPFQLWFLRRNEIWLEVADESRIPESTGL